MSEEITLEEAIRTAIEYETKVRDVYKEAQQQIDDSKGKHVMGALFSEEQGHLDYLNSRLSEWKKTGDLNIEELNTHIPSHEVISEKTQVLKEKVKVGEDDRRHDMEITMLRKALTLEEETSNFYKKMVGTLPDKGQQLFARFVEIEEGHLAIVQAELDYISGPGYWFDFKEFDLAGGY
jgi:rubrerythrin